MIIALGVGGCRCVYSAVGTVPSDLGVGRSLSVPRGKLRGKRRREVKLSATRRLLRSEVCC